MVWATLGEGPGSNEIEQSYWMRAINWTPWPLDGESKTKKWQIKGKTTWHHFGRKFDRFKPPNKKKKKKLIKRRAHNLKNQRAS